MSLTQHKLKTLLDYNSETGVFTWICTSKYSNLLPGDIAGCLDNKGYRIITIEEKSYKAHRLAFLWMEGYLPENAVDHFDRNKDNNAWSNLREVSAQCNARNRAIISTNRSGITGVCWSKATKKWQATIRVASKNIYLGQFDNIIDAAKARWKGEKLYNFPNCNSTSSAYQFLTKCNAIS